MDRSEYSRMLAKIIAYYTCGKREDARAWARKLIDRLESDLGGIC